MVQYKPIKEVSAVVGISVTSLRRGIKSGRFGFIRAGVGKGKLLLDVEAVVKQLDFEALNSPSHTTSVGLLDVTALEKSQGVVKALNSFDAFTNKK